MDLETAARKRREKVGGKEHVHASGLATVRNAEDSRRADALEAKVRAWGSEATIEEQVRENAAARSPQEAHMRAIVDACED